MSTMCPTMWRFGVCSDSQPWVTPQNPFHEFIRASHSVMPMTHTDLVIMLQNSSRYSAAFKKRGASGPRRAVPLCFLKKERRKRNTQYDSAAFVFSLRSELPPTIFVVNDWTCVRFDECNPDSTRYL